MDEQTYPACPLCRQTDKVEPVSLIVEKAYSQPPASDYGQISWAGRTYYVPLKTKKPMPVVPPVRGQRGRVITEERVASFDLFLSSTVNTSDKYDVRGPASHLLPLLEEPARLQVPEVKTIGILLLWPGLFIVVNRLGKIIKFKPLEKLGLYLAVLASWPSGLVYSLLIYGKRRYNQLLKQYSDKQLRRPQAEARWLELYYCYNCDGFFSRDSELLPVYQLDRYLYS